jgi:hypothetical protein
VPIVKFEDACWGGQQHDRAAYRLLGLGERAVVAGSDAVLWAAVR